MGWDQLYIAPNIKNWNGKATTGLNSPVFCKSINSIEGSDTGFAILGFCSDTGVRRNNGRAGASHGPKAIRACLSNLSFPLGTKQIIDYGDIKVGDNDDLEFAQQALGSCVKKVIKIGHIPIILGGGHETAWGHYLGLCDSLKNKKLAIINFDAHFDLRDLIEGKLGTSGTPFYQIALDRKKHNQEFNYLCIGIQNLANSKHLFKRAEELSVNFVNSEDIHGNNVENVKKVIDNSMRKSDCVYLSICLDVFSESIAPGVSAPQKLGLYLEQVLPLLQVIIDSGKVIAIDLVELSPKHDVNNITGNLAAKIIMEILSQVNVTT